MKLLIDYGIKTFFSLGALGALGVGVRIFASMLFHAFFQEDAEGEDEYQPRFERAYTAYIVCLTSIVIVGLVGLGLALSFIWGAHAASIEWWKNIDSWSVKVDKKGRVFGVSQLGILLGFWFGGLFASSVLRRGLCNAVYGMFLLEDGTRAITDRIMHYLILFVVMMVGMHWVGLGGFIWQMILVMSFGVTMGLKDVILDVFAGVWLLLERSIEPTHYVDIDGKSGVVVDIGVRKTLLDTDDGIIVLPNRVLLNKPFINWSKTNMRVVVCDFSFSLNTELSPEEVVSKTKEFFRQSTALYSPPRSGIRLDTFSAISQSYTVRLAFKRKAFTEQDGILHETKMALHKVFQSPKK